MKRGNKDSMKKKISRYLSVMICICMVFQTAYLPVQAGSDSLNGIQIQSEGQDEAEQVAETGSEAQVQKEAPSETNIQTETEIQTESEEAPETEVQTESQEAQETEVQTEFKAATETEVQTETEAVKESEAQSKKSAAPLETTGNLLEDVRRQAQTDFAGGVNADAQAVDLNLSDRTFDGTAAGAIDYTSEEYGGADSPYLKVPNNLRTNDIGGSIIFKFKTNTSGVIFGAGSSDADDGNNMVFGINNAGELRAYFRNDKSNGLKANLSVNSVNLKDNKWHTIAVSFHSGQAEDTYVVIDGSDNIYPSGWWSIWNPGFNKNVNNNQLPYTNFTIGGGIYNASSFYSLGNFNGKIDFVTVTDQSFTVAQLKEMTQKAPDLNDFSVMQAAGTANTWLMTGSDTAVPKFDQVGPVKNYVGFFEDNLRAGGTYVERSRFVFNTAQSGLTISELNTKYDKLIDQYGPKAVGIMVDRSDYEKGEAGTEAFKADLRTLLDRLYEDQRIPFIITPAPSLSNEDNALISIYTEAIKEEAAVKETVVVDITGLDTSYLEQGNYLTALGHQEIANRIKTTLGIGHTTAYTGFSLPVNPTLLKVDASPAVQVKADQIQVDAPKGYTDLDWSYELSYDGQVISREQVAAPFTITGLKTGTEYVLRMTSDEGNTRRQLRDVRFTAAENGEAHALAQEDGNVNTIEDITNLLNSQDPVTYLFMGDSITHGVLTSGYDNVPELFEKYLREQGRQQDVVINTGVSNATVSTTLDQIDRRLNQFHPDVVMVMLGTNDASTRGEVAGSAATGFTVEEFKNNYKELVRDIYQNNPGSYIVLRVPCDMNPDDPRKNYKDYFNAIYDVEQDMKAELSDIKITVVDHMKNWIAYGENVRNDFLNTGSNGWLVDNVHPNGRGNMAMFQQILKETGLYKNDSAISNYSYKFSDWADSSSIAAEVTFDGTKKEASFDPSVLAAYENGLQDMTVSITDVNGVAISKTSNYGSEGMKIKVPEDFIPYSAKVTGTDAKNHKEITFAASLKLTSDPECTCAISNLVFADREVVIPQDKDSMEISLEAVGDITGDCKAEGHSSKTITYVYEKAEDQQNIGTIRQNKLTLSKAGTIKVRVNALIPGTVASAEKTAVFTVKKEGQDPAVLFQKSEVKIVKGVPTKPVDYTGALDKLKGLTQGTVTVRYKKSDTGLMSLFSVSNKNQNATHTHVYVNDGTVGYEVRNNNTNVNAASAGVSNMTRDEWHTVTYVFAPTGTSVYFDGERVINNTSTGFVSSSQGVNTVDLGKTQRSDGGNQYPLTGSISYIEVRSDLLTQEQITDIHKVTLREEKEAELPKDAFKSEDQQLFYNGYKGSASHRIPSLLTTRNGVVLAAIDKRQSGPGDQGNIDTAIRRSFDNGKNWTDGQTIINLPAGQQQHSLTIDAAMVEDEVNGRVFLLVDMFPESKAAMDTSLLEKGSGYKQVGDKSYCILRDYESVLNTTHNYTKTYTIREHGEVWLEGAEEADARPTDYTVPDFSTGELFKDDKPAGNIFLYTGSNAGELKVVRNMRIWSTYSDDDGETWSKPVDLTPMIKEDWMLFCGTGPGVGIQVKKGEHAGRLIVPIYVANQNWTSAQAATSIYSDDYGVTWQRTQMSPLEAAGTDLSTMNNGGAILTESQIVEMNDGTLIQFCRNVSGSLKYSISTDSGTTWGEPVRDTGVPEVYCQLTATHYPEKIDGKEAIILANPNGPARNNGMARIGLYNPQDKTFEWKYSQLVKSGSYAYSCLSILPDGNIGLFYEGDNQTMEYTSFNVEWIKADLTVPMKEPVIENVAMEKSDNQIEFTVDFDSYMIKTGNPVLKFNMDGVPKEAVYVSGNTTKQFVFRYTGITQITTGLTVTNVGVTAADADSEIGNALCMLPLESEFKFAPDGTPECTCKIEDIGLLPEEIMIPAKVDEYTAELTGTMKESTCAKEGHTFRPVYTYTVADAGETGAVITGSKLKVSGAGVVKINVAAELNGKTGNADCTITVTKAEPGETVNQPPAAKDPMPNQEVNSLKGTTFTAQDIAEDPDGDTITITKIVSEPDSFIITELSEGVVSLYGSNKGTSRMMVNVSDGKNVSTIVVPITVTEEGSYDKTDYLSDHDYLDQANSSVGYWEGTGDKIKVDTNQDGGTMSLLDENGKRVSFNKGYGAHCTSTLIFNLPEGHNYKKFETYYGIDASKPAVAAVTFKITVDGTVVHISDKALQSTSPMGFASVDISGAKTLKLEAIAKDGNIGSGHSQWSGCKLVSQEDPSNVTDKSVLEKKIAEAKAIKGDEYAQASYKNLLDAIDRAQEVLDAQDTEQLEVFQQMQALKAAVKGLEKAVPADQVAVSLKTLSLEVGEGRRLYADVTTNDGKASNDQITWSSSRPEIAEVSANGKVTAAAPGKTVITATSTSGKTDSCTVTVKGCTCELQTPVFADQKVTIPYLESSRQIELKAEAALTGDCQMPGHADQDITYTYVITEDQDGIGSIKGNMLTVSGAGTVKVTVTASVNDKTSTASAIFTISKEEAPIPEKYTAAFIGGDGAEGTAPSAIQAEAQTKITLPKNTFTKNGYLFIGWFDGTRVYQADTQYTMPDKNITFTAQWQKKEEPKPVTYKLTFDARGGKVSPASITVTQGTVYGTLPVPTRDGYSFNGWFTAVSGGAQIKAGQVCSLKANTTVYAQWTKITLKKPAKPTGVKASKNKSGSIRISWKKASNATGYIVYRYNSSSKKWSKIKTTKDTSYVNTGLKSGTDYKYKVKAYSQLGKEKKYSSYSSVMKTSTAPAKPRLIQAKKAGKGKVALKWNKKSGTDGFVIYMKTNNKGEYKKIASKSAKTLSYTKSGLKKGRSYRFKVRAYHKVGNKKIYSSYSASKSVKF